MGWKLLGVGSKEPEKVKDLKQVRKYYELKIQELNDSYDQKCPMCEVVLDKNGIETLIEKFKIDISKIDQEIESYQVKN